MALDGGLGAGKTTFVRGLARALDLRDQVSSPTFTLRHRYQGSEGRPALEHLDLYRIGDEREVRDAGLEEALTDDAIVAIEWLERVPSFARPDWRVSIEGSGELPRTVSIERA